MTTMVVIPLEILSDKRLNSNDKIVAGYVKNKTEYFGKCLSNVNYISKDIHMETLDIVESLRKLKDLDLVTSTLKDDFGNYAWGWVQSLNPAILNNLDTLPAKKAKPKPEILTYNLPDEVIAVED